MSMSKYASKADYEKAQRDATGGQTPRTDAIALRSMNSNDPRQIMQDLAMLCRELELELSARSETATTTNAAPQSAPSAGIHSGEDLPSAVAAPSDACRQELENIVKAKRFDREVFQDDSEFANWVVSRCRHALSSPSATVTPKLRLYVWEDVLYDYTAGVMFALAGSVEEAKAEIKKHTSYVPDDDLAKEPKVIDVPVGFAVWGGG